MWTTRIFGVFVMLLWLVCPCNAQIPGNNPPDLRGYFNAEIFGNTISGINRRSDPFGYRLNGILSFDSWVLKTNASFHISTSRRAYSVNLPDVKIPGYALVGISPEYRWARFHLGNRYMHFSDYSFSNHSFYGTGVELSPGNFRLSAFYGRLKRENASNVGLRQSLDPTFKRMGWGVKLGVENESNYAFLGLFKAFDKDKNARLELTALNTYPQENVVTSITAGRKVGNRINLEIDYAWSAISRNTLAEEITDSDAFGVFKSFFGLFAPLQSSEFKKALKTKLTFNSSQGPFHIMHERVDPGYRSLGALFFNNDFESFTGGSMVNLLDNKLSVSINGGFQRNNLSGKESNTYTRVVGRLNASLNLSERSNLAISFSNFSTTNILYATSIPIIQVDSVNLSQVSRQFSLSFFNALGPDNNSIIQGSVSYFKSKAIQNDLVLDDQTNNNLVVNLMGSFRLSPSGWSTTSGLLINRNQNEVNNILTVSPHIGLTKSFLNNDISLRSRINVVNLYVNNSYRQTILQPQVSMTYGLSPSHKLELLGVFTRRFYNEQSSKSFSELSFRLGWKTRL